MAKGAVYPFVILIIKNIRGVLSLQDTKYITIVSNKKKIILNTDIILYVLMNGNNADIHVTGGTVYTTRMTFSELEKELGYGFVKIHRGGIVSVKAIHEITDKINLSNGEALTYTVRKKNQIIESFRKMQNHVISNFSRSGIPSNDEEYKQHYASFENMPFAFTDIELIFNEKIHAIDWIFRYGNPALAQLEKVSLDKLIGHSFGSVFPNMDSKWLRSYERATLYGETLEIIDYSPEIDTYLKVICFPTFKGHCGCILFNVEDIKFTKNSSDAEKALLLYFGKTPEKNK